MVLSALFSIHVPQDAIASVLGKGNPMSVLYAATLGVPLYLCGIPILIMWLASGMSKGAAVAFMLSGPATKINNLAALKAVLGLKHFCYYIAFVIITALILGLATHILSATVGL